MIIIDERERDVKEYFAADNTPYKEEVLPTGDYTNEDRDFLVERKKSFDLISSLKSKHIYVQLAEMRDLNPDTPLFLIFEGDYDALIESQNDLGLRMLLTTFPNKLAHIFGIQFIKVYNTLDMIKELKILDVYAKGIKDLDRLFEGIHTTNNYDERIKHLMIPHLGQTNAKTLLNEYGSIQEVLSACLNKPKEVMKLDGIGKTSVDNLIKMFIGKEPYYKKRNQAKVNVDNKDKEAEDKKRKQRFAIQNSKYNKGAK